jgi:hypothetical protein
MKSQYISGLLAASLTLLLGACSGAPGTEDTGEAVGLAVDGAPIKVERDKLTGAIVRYYGTDQKGVAHEILVDAGRRYAYRHVIDEPKTPMERLYFVTRSEYRENGKPVLTVATGIEPYGHIFITKIRSGDAEIRCTADFSHVQKLGYGLVTRRFTIAGQEKEFQTAEWMATSPTPPINCGADALGEAVQHVGDWYAPYLRDRVKAMGAQAESELAAFGRSTATPARWLTGAIPAGAKPIAPLAPLSLPALPDEQGDRDRKRAARDAVVHGWFTAGSLSLLCLVLPGGPEKPITTGACLQGAIWSGVSVTAWEAYSGITKANDAEEDRKKAQERGGTGSGGCGGCGSRNDAGGSDEGGGRYHPPSPGDVGLSPGQENRRTNPQGPIMAGGEQDWPEDSGGDGDGNVPPSGPMGGCENEPPTRPAGLGTVRLTHLCN